MSDIHFEQWHPDAQRQCGFWWDLSPIACGQCERCQKEQRHRPVVQPPATPQEPDTYGPFFDPCDKCVTRTHCAHHDRCLAECVPADLRTSAPPAVWQPIETAPTGTYVLAFWQRFGCYEVVKLDPAKGWIDEDDSDYVAPSHWMPLPSPTTPGETR